jgi:hypothetical protein
LKKRHNKKIVFYFVRDVSGIFGGKRGDTVLEAIRACHRPKLFFITRGETKYLYNV